MIMRKDSVFDFKRDLRIRCTIPPSIIWKGVQYECRTYRFLTTPRFHAAPRIQKMRRALSWQLSNQNLLLSRSVPLHGIRSTYFPRKPERHRNLLASRAEKTLSRRFARQSITQYSGQSQRKSPLANICRLRPNPDQKGAHALRQRPLRPRSQKNRLRARFNHHRPLPDVVSMGAVSPAQKRGQDAHADGSARQYPQFYLYYRRSGS